MAQYVNIMLDEGFKAVFGNKQVAIDFINAALEGERQVKDLTYLDKEIRPEFIDQGESGRDWKYELLPVYGIYLLNFSLPEFHNCRTNVVMANEETGETFGEIKLKQIYISFELFNLREKECSNSLENMIYMLKNMNLFEMSPFKEKNDAFRRLLDVANLNALTAHERAVYDENLKNYRDWRSTTEYAVEEAEKKGLEKGREKGREEGLEEGKAEEQRQIATNLKKLGIDIAMIAQSTGLSREEIEKL